MKWIFFLIFPALLSFTSDSEYYKPLQKYLFDRDGYYFLIHENWFDYKIMIIANPYTLENYKDQLEIRRENIESTPQFHFTVVKDNKIKEMIGYFETDQVKMGKDLEQSFKKVRKFESKRLPEKEYRKLIDSLDNKGVLWVGSQIQKYSGKFRINAKINRDIDKKHAGSEISENIFDYLISRYPILTNRLDIFFSSSNPNDDFVIWKIDISGDKDFDKLVKTVNLSDNILISDYEYIGYEENLYSLRYFEWIK